MPNGFVGKILRVNLTTSTVSTVDTMAYVPKYVGGRGIATKIYFDEVMPEVKAFDPGNKLIFMTGPLQGTIWSAGRMTCVGKSSQTLTESICDSNAGGFFAPELKFAGWDGIIVEGKAANPVYINIMDSQVQILDAYDLWGLSTFDTETEIWRKQGWKTRVLVIGPAGEHLIRTACILTDSGDAFGQGGFGGVMGSKNLKAIAVRGTGGVTVADPTAVFSLKDSCEKYHGPRPGETVTDFAGTKVTGALPQALSQTGSTGAGDQERGIVRLRSVSCAGCSQADKVGQQYRDNSLAPGAGMCDDIGSHYVLDNMNYVTSGRNSRTNWEWVQMAQSLGLNVYELPDGKTNSSLGKLLHFFDSLIKEGILTNANTGWPLDKFGLLEFSRQVLPDIAYRRGFGDKWAEGQVRVVNYIMSNEAFGPNRARAAYWLSMAYPKAGNFDGWITHMNVLPTDLQYSTMVYWGVQNRDPQTKHIDQAFYSGPQGSTVESAAWVAALQKQMKQWAGTDKPIVPPGYDDSWLAARWWIQRTWELDCMIICDYLRWFHWDRYTADGTGDMDLSSKLMNAVTGSKYTTQQLWSELERPWTLERAIACREGRRAADDLFKDTFISDSVACVDAKGRRFDNTKIPTAMQSFYQTVGWTTNGVPTRARLEALDLKDVADDLEKRGVK